MREFAKIGPKFWVGETGKAIRRRGSEAVVMAMYLMTSPHSNMLGLYSQPILYAAHETGLGPEGASLGLRHCIEVGFCAYDEESEMVWVFKMARYQIAEALLPTDKRCKGIQNDYDALPMCPFLGPFFDRYSVAYNLTKRRDQKNKCDAPSEAPYQAPSKQREGEREGEGEGKSEGASAPPAPPPPPKPKTKKTKPPEVTLAEWLDAEKAAERKAVPADDPIFAYADQIGLPREFLHLAWAEFKVRYTAEPVKGERPKTYNDWRAVFRKAVREGWLKLWFLDGQQYALTTAGQQAQRVQQNGGAA